MYLWLFKLDTKVDSLLFGYLKLFNPSFSRTLKSLLWCIKNRTAEQMYYLTFQKLIDKNYDNKNEKPLQFFTLKYSQLNYYSV